MERFLDPFDNFMSFGEVPASITTIRKLLNLSKRTGPNSPCDGGVFCFGGLHWKHQKSYIPFKEIRMKNLNVIFNGIAVAMGIAIIVLNIVNPLCLATTTTLLGVWVTALGIANLQGVSS